MFKLNTNENKQEFENILKDILENSQVLKMKEYIQHYDTTLFDHCYNVAWITFKMCKLFHLDYVKATRASMLHDLFLYDWRVKSKKRSKWHAFKHPYVAMKTAEKEFKLSDKEKDIILKHMWPVTIIPPKSLEGFCVTITDKYSAIYESLIHYQKSYIFKYSYVLWAILFFKINF